MTGNLLPDVHRLIKAEIGTLIWSERAGDGGRAVIKLYRNRPLHDPLRRLFVPYRAEREYRILERLRRGGVACPEPLGWSHGRDRVHGRTELLATREIEDAVELTELLGRRGALPDLAPLFALCRRMHECGVAHGALYPRNVLVSGSGGPVPVFHLIDFAHGRAFAHSLVGTWPARYDLFDLLRTLARESPLDAAAEWLAAYGLPPQAAQALLGQVPEHRMQRPWRHFRRIAVDAFTLRDRLRILDRLNRLRRPDATRA